MTQGVKKEKMPIVRKFNILVVIIAAVMLLLCFIDTYELSDASSIQVIEPYTVATLSDGSKEYFFDLQDYDYHYSGIMFYTSHQAVTAYYSGQEIYLFTKTGGIWTSSTGAAYHFVDINEQMLQIAIIVTPIYDVVANQSITFYIGNSHEMIDEIMLESMPRFYVSFLILILSVLLFIYYIVMHEKQGLNKQVLFLAYFSLFVGIWSINETDVSSLLTSNRIVESIIPYLCLMLVVPPFILFFDSYLGINSKYLKRVIIWASMVQFVVLTALHFLKIAEYRETLFVTQFMLLIAAIYMLGGLAEQLIRRKFTRQVEICAVGLSLFLLALIVDLRKYYSSLGDADSLGRYVFLIFVFMLAWDMIKDANEVIEKGRRARQLEIFALTDSMTGLLNRNAFESHAKAGGKLDGIVAVVADANGLKKCNDTYGHEAGDAYITVVAEIFSNVYGKYGNCYRTGGDEFCCIMPAGNHANLERLKKLFLAKIYTANLEGNYQFSIGVAIGAAQYDANLDGDFRALVKRADASMYEDKRAYKTS